MTSSFLLFSRFGQYLLWHYSGVCQTQEPTQNFKLHPLLNPRGLPVLILLTITYRRWFPELLRRQSSGGCWFNPDCRQVTIPEYLTLVMVNRIRTGNPCGFNKGCSSKFHVGSQVRKTPEEGWMTDRPKRKNSNKDEDNNLKTLNDKNHQASSQKFRQLIFVYFFFIIV